MPRKGENIRKRKDGRWEARYIKERKPDGRIQYGYVYAPKYTLVKEKRNQILAAISMPDPVPATRIFTEWLAKVRYSVKESSYCYYDTIISTHLSPYFQQTSLQELSATLIQDLIFTLEMRHLSASYIQTILLILKSSLKMAQARNYIIECPEIRYASSGNTASAQVFTLSEWKQLEDYLLLTHTCFSFGLLLCMYTGLRIGELSGLKWMDIQWDTGELLIRRTVYRIRNLNYTPDSGEPHTCIHIGPPKTISSRRHIPLPSALLELARKYRTEPEYYILTGTSHCMEPRTIQRRFQQILKECDIPYHNFHTLRHSFATLSIQKGCDYKTLSELLGHASANITMNIYVHSDAERKRQCLELLLS